MILPNQSLPVDHSSIDDRTRALYMGYCIDYPAYRIENTAVGCDGVVKAQSDVGDTMITEEQYKAAVVAKDVAESLINQFHAERMESFQQRLKTNPIFADDELVYSRETLCPCGHGLTYPKGCGPGHYWDCSAILKGVADPAVKHTGQLPFVFYDVKSEQGTATTRGVFRPKAEEAVMKMPKEFCSPSNSMTYGGV